MKKTLFSALFITTTISYNAYAASSLSYTPKLGADASYNLTFTETTASAPYKFTYLFQKPDNSLEIHYINYDWSIKDKTFGEAAGDPTPNIYLQWQTDVDGNLVLNAVSPTTPEFGVNYDIAAYVDPNLNQKLINTSTTAIDIDHSFIGLTLTDNTKGSAIYNGVGYKIGDINGDFIGNKTIVSDPSSIATATLYNEGSIENINSNFIGNLGTTNITTGSLSSLIGTAITNRTGGDIGSINGDFIGNAIIVPDSTPIRIPVAGAAITNRYGTASNYTTIGSITGDFIGNYISSLTDSRALIYNMEYARIENISSNFIGNVVETSTIEAEGSGIYNAHWNPTGVGGEIGTISGDFTNNVSKSGGAAYGAAIYQGSSASIDKIENSTFIGNLAQAGTTAVGGAIYNTNSTISDVTNVNFNSNVASSGTGHAIGGAIANLEGGEITSITDGNFVGNYATSTSSYGYGGAIYNLASTITTLDADFIGNYISASGYSYGGAIYNYYGSTIGDITGNFSNNYANGSSLSYGGAIYNSDATIGNITGNFSNNYAVSTSSYAYGGTIYNLGATIGNITGDFIGNSANAYSTGRGGAINNVYGGNIGDILGKFENNSVNSTNGSAAGGAILNITGADNAIINIGQITGDFTGNFTNAKTTSFGGAIYNNASHLNAEINNSGITGDFTGNYAQSDTSSASGGAIYQILSSATSSNDTTITGDFIGNYTKSNSGTAAGGAIILSGSSADTTKNVLNLIDSNFFDNYASGGPGSHSGAIYNSSSSLSLSANTKDIYFSGNYQERSGVKNYTAIYHYSPNMVLNANNGNDIIFNDAIYSNKTTNEINFGSTAGTTGRLVFNDDIRNVNLKINSGTLVLGEENSYMDDAYTGVGARDIDIQTLSYFTTSSLTMGADTTLDTMNNVIQTNSVQTLTLNGDIDLQLDIDIQAGTGDMFTATLLENTGNHKITITDLNLLTDLEEMSSTIKITNDVLKDSIVLSNTVNLYQPSGSTVDYSNMIKYSNLTGEIIFAFSNLNISFADTFAQKVYNMTSNETLGGDLGALGGDYLIVNANGSNISGDSTYAGGSIADGQILIFNNLGTVSDFNGAFITDNSGDLVITANTYENASGVDTNTNTIINSDIVNNMALHLVANTDNSITLNNAITGTGSIDINHPLINTGNSDDNDGLGTITFNNTIDQDSITVKNGTVVFNDAITGDLNVSGGNVSVNDSFAGDISLSQTSSVKSILNLKSTQTNFNSLTLDGTPTFSMINGNISHTLFDTVNFLNTSKSSLELDINLATPDSDSIDATTVNGVGSIVISKLNILADPLTMPQSVNVAGAGIKNYITLSEDLDINEISVPLSGDGFIIHYTSADGNINFGFSSFQEAVESSIPQKAFTFARDITLDTLNPDLNGTSLSIDGNGFSLTANTTLDGVNVGDMKNMSLREVATISGFGTAITNDGTLSLTADNGIDMLFTGNTTDVNNTNTMTAQATANRKITFDGEITGGGLIRTNNESNETGEIIFNGSVVGPVHSYYGTTTFNGALSNSLTVTDGITNLNGDYSTGVISLGDGQLNIGTGATFTSAIFQTTGDGTLNLINGQINKYEFGGVELNGSTNLMIDVDLEAKAGDYITTSSGAVSGTGEFVITDVQVIADSINSAYVAEIADYKTRGLISLADDVNIINGPGLLEDYTGYFVSYDNTNGYLTFLIETLQYAIESELSDKRYTMTKDEGITTTLGQMNGERLIVESDGHSIIGDGTATGVLIGTATETDQNLYFRNLGTVSGFDGDFATLNGDFGTELHIEANSNDTTISNQITNNGGKLWFETDNDYTITVSDIIGGTETTDTGITTSGNVIFDGDVTNNNVTMQNGELVANGNFTNSNISSFVGDVYINAGFDSGIIGTVSDSNIYLGKDSVLSNSLIDLKNSSLHLANDAVQTVNANILFLTGTNNLTLDIDLANSDGDYLDINNQSGSGNLKLTELNIISEATEIETTVNIASEAIREHILEDLTGLTVNQKDDLTESYSSYFIGYSQSTGDLTFAYHGLNAAILSIVDTKSYTMKTDEDVIANLGSMAGNTLLINGGGFDITGNNTTTGVTVGDGKTLTIQDVANFSGFDGSSVISDGTVIINADNNNMNFAETIEATEFGTIELNAQDGMTITLANGFTGAGTFEKDGAGDLIISSTADVDFTGTFTQMGMGTTTLNLDTANMFAGDVSINQGGINTTVTTANGFTGTLYQGSDVDSATLTNTVSNAFAGTYTMVGGEITLNNATDDAFTGTFISNGGTINLGGNGYLFDNARFIVNDDTFINLSDNDMRDYNFDRLTLNSDLFVDIDVDLSGTTDSDTFSAGTVIGSDKIVISSVNILGNPDVIETSVQIADNSIRNYIELDADISSNITQPAGSNINYGSLIGYDNTSGFLTFKYSDFASAVTFDFSDKVYNMNGDETIDANIGTMKGDVLTINADGNDITANNIGGITLVSGQELTLNDIGTVSGFATNSSFVYNQSGSIVNINADNNDTVISSNMTNYGNLNLNATGSNTITMGAINGSGTTTTNGTIILSSYVNGGTINANSGSLEIQNSVTGGNIIMGNGTTMILGTSSYFAGSDLSLNNTTVLADNGDIDYMTFDNIDLTGTSNVSIDIDLENGYADSITAQTISGTGTIDITELNILSDLTSMPATGENIVISNSVLGDRINTLGMNLVDASGGLVEDYVGGYLITYDSATGILNFNHADLISAMASNVNDKVYALKSTDLDITSDLGTFNGTNFTIDGGGQTLTGNSNNGFVTSSGQNFAIRETNMSGFDTAIENLGDTNVISGGGDITFMNNTIAINNDSNLNITTENGDITFLSNNSGLVNSGTANLYATSGDILFENNVTGINNTDTLNMFAGANHKIVLDSPVIGNGMININNDLASTGTIVIDNDAFAGYTGDTYFYNGTIEVLRPTSVIIPSGDPLLPDTVDPSPTEYTDFIGGNFIVESLAGANAPTLDLLNNARDTLDAANWTLNGNLDVELDIDLLNNWADSFINTDDTWTGSINITNLNILTDVEFTKTISLSDYTGGGKFELDPSITTAMGPIYIYDVDSSNLATTGNLTFTSQDKLNPAIFISEVMGNINTVSQYHLIDQVMTNFATSGVDGAWDRSFYGYGYDSDKPYFWARAYGYDEETSMSNDLTTSGNYYGTIVGVDTPVQYIAPCTTTLFSVYGGYYGSSSEYIGGEINETGYVLGARAALHKYDFFTAVSAHYANSEFEGTTMFGIDEASTDTFAASAQMGYNFWLSMDKTSLVPMINASYLNTTRPEYENASGISVTAETIAALQLGGELRLTQYFTGNWQGYGAIGYNWNDMSSDAVFADTTAIPEFIFGSYAIGKLGALKHFDTNWRGHIEAQGMTGDRSGVGIELGVSIAF